MDYQAQDQAAREADNIARTAQALAEAAVAVMAEATSTAGHTERAHYAQRVLRDPLREAKQAVRAVVTNPNAGTGTDDPLTDDSALLFVVSSLWNALAGYSAG